MTDVTEPPAATPPPPAGKNRWVIAGFIAVGIGLLAFNHLRGRSVDPPDNWGEDLTAALATGKAEGRQIVVLFVYEPPSQTTRNLIRYTIEKPDNRKAVKDGKFVPVMVRVNGPDEAELKERYQLKEIPTLILLSPDGSEICRREGQETKPEVPFRTDFLAGQ